MAGFELKHVVPWGRSFDEYRRMFALSESELHGRLLGCGDGPAAFNCEATKRGSQIVSCDPLYQYDGAQVRARIDATFAEILEQTRRNHADFIWREIPDIDALGRVRTAAMQQFLADYPSGRNSGRYVAAALPTLPFADSEFDLALCSHLLFLYTEHLSREFHVQSTLELCRVATEVRIFPLVTLKAQRSPYVDDVIAAVEAHGCAATVASVDYEFQRGANQMLRIIRDDAGLQPRPSSEGLVV